MHRFPRILVNGLLPAALCVLVAGGTRLQAQPSAGAVSIRGVKVLSEKDAVEIEVDASDRIVPETRVLTGPDRLVVDFPNAVPGGQLRNRPVNRGDVKDVRVGLFQARPPITRIVLDLKAAQSYQVFPYGRTVMIKVTSGALEASVDVDDSSSAPPTRPGLVVTNYSRGAEKIHADAPRPPLEVSFRNGMLTIWANKVTLSEVLYAVQQRTGADIGIAAGAEQEKVVVDLGPAPAADVLSALLNGSKFNYLILSAANNPQQLDRVILTPRGTAVVRPQAPPRNDDDGDEQPGRPAPVQGPVVNGVPQAPRPPQDPQTRTDDPSDPQ